MEARSDDIQRLNPQIRETYIGVTNLRKITVYPLSVAKQLSLENVITEMILKFNVGEDLAPEDIMRFFFQFIKENVNTVLSFVIKEENILDDLTNDQLTEIIKIIYESNYAISIKNVQSLFDQVKNQFLSERPLQQSVNDMDTVSKISSSEDTGKEELQEAS